MFQWNFSQIPILQLGPDYYDPVQPALFPEQKLRYLNQKLYQTIQTTNFLSAERLCDFKPLAHNLVTPLALRYHGHQFQHYNPNLGDGRGFLYAQLFINNEWYDLGTKGSGQTPYSRAGDGRLTLKGAFREALATEMLTVLGVTTSQTLCFYETGEQLERNDEPSPTRSAVLTRFSRGHIRVGTFQRLAYLRQTENIKKLISYCLFFYAPKIHKELVQNEASELTWATRFLEFSIKKNAESVAEVMLAGFVHGVLNTDNINVVGELFDYGPYRFLPNYDLDFTAAYFDQQGLYCYGRQPSAFLWALHQLAFSLKTALPDLPTEPLLNEFSEHFHKHVQKLFFKKLNLKPKKSEMDQQLLATFFQFLEEKQRPFAATFFHFESLKILENKKWLDLYENESSAHFKNLLNQLNHYEIANAEIQKAEFKKNEQPLQLLIDEIEKIWNPIAEHDDWSLFQNKIQSIRQNTVDSAQLI